MKNVFFVIAIFFCYTAKGQSFDGVYIGGSAYDVVNKFKAKGYKVEVSDENGYTLSTTMDGQEVELYLIQTPISKKACKVSIYFPKKSSWNSLLNEYLRYANFFSEKYGKPYLSRSDFDEPYYLGDGYELQALGLEKCNYRSIWLNVKNANMVVEISKYKQINIVYENSELIELFTEEKKQKLSTKF